MGVFFSRSSSVALICVFLLCVFGGIGAAGADSLEQALAYQKTGDLPEAIITMKNAVAEDPSNPEKRWLLGALLLETGAWGAAEKEYRRALDFGMSAESVHPKLAKALLKQNKTEAVINLPVPPGAQAPDIAILRSTRGIAWLLMGDLKAAEREIDRALRADPVSAEAMTAAARLSLAEQDREAAERWLNGALETNPKEADAWGL